MDMHLWYPWLVLLAVALAGALGGVFNALLTDNGFVKPYTERVGPFQVVRPGMIGNILIGACAATISWGLYGRAGALPLLAPMPPVDISAKEASLLASDFAAALLLGVAGARWLTTEVDKRLLHAAASTAAKAEASTEAAQEIAAAPAAQVVGVVKAMPAPADWRARQPA